MTRRQAMALAAVPLSAQRIPPAEELANTLEMESMARQKLAPELFQQVAGSERAAFERITFRPRMMVNTLALNLTTELFGHRHFAPILVGPIALQGRFHPGAERELRTGADAAKTSVVFAAKTTIPHDQLSPAWLQYSPELPVPTNAQALIVTAPFEWPSIIQLRAKTKLPLILKGIMSPSDALAAIKVGADGIVVSNYRTRTATGLAAPIEVLPSIAAAVGKKVPILIDGSFRRGSDILKAIALGATAVFIGRPAIWGLAAYGARGVQHILEQLQTELARDMAMCGLRTPKEAGPQYVKIHRR